MFKVLTTATTFRRIQDLITCKVNLNLTLIPVEVDVQERPLSPLIGHLIPHLIHERIWSGRCL